MSVRIPILRVLCLLALALCCPLLAAQSQASIELRDLDGKSHRPLETAEAKAVVIVFITNDCPVCNAYAPEINRICSAYANKGILIYLVHVDPSLSVEDARKHARDFGFTCPVLLDPRHELVAALDAKITPEAFVVSSGMKTVYHGRIDNTYADFGKARQVVTQHDLRDTLDATLAGKPVPSAHTDVIGCYIQERKGEAK